MDPFEYGDPDPELADRAREFVEDVVLPADRGRDGAEPITRETVGRLRQEARDDGVYAPTAPAEYGGMGLDLRTALPVFEQAGRSVLGPPAVRIDPPDQGNAALLERVGSEAQKERWLRPLVAGEIGSAFSMTEPPPGAGSDPSMLETTAVRDGDGWVVDGHKWWTTGGADADVLIVLARTGPEVGPDEGSSLFLVPGDADGIEVVRELTPTSRHGRHGHAEIVYDGVRVPAENLLGEPGAGLGHARERVPASRLGRCMRSAGMARRALDVAAAYVTEREAFGGVLADKQAVRFALAGAAADLHAARVLTRRTARRVVEGEDAPLDIAACKGVVERAVADAVSAAVDVCGASGVGTDLPLSAFYARTRPKRAGVGDASGKRAIADAILDPDAIDRHELDPLTRF